MTIEEMHQAAERQRIAMQETVNRELMAMHRRAIAQEMLHALEAVENPNGTWRLPGEELPSTW